MAEAPNVGEVRDIKKALELEGILAEQKGDKYILFFADWCGHCQTYKPFWEKLSKVAGRIATMAAVQDTQKENVPSLKDAELDGYPTVIRVTKDGKTEKVSPQEMRDEAKMMARLTESTKKGTQEALVGDGSIGYVNQIGAGLVAMTRKALHKVRSLLPIKSRKAKRHMKHRNDSRRNDSRRNDSRRNDSRRNDSRKNPTTRKAKRHGRKLV